MRRTLARLATIIGRRRFGQLALSVAFMLAAAACEAVGIGLVFYLVMSLQATDAFLAMPSVARLREWLGIGSTNGFLIAICSAFIALFAAKATISLVAAWIKVKLQWAIHAELTRTLFESYLRAPLSFHTRTNSNALLQTITTGVAQTTQNGFVAMTEVVSDSILMLAIVGAVIVVQPWVGGGALIGGALFVLLYWRVGQPHFTRWGRDAKAMGQATIRATVEPLTGIRAVKAIGAERFFADKLSGYLSAYGLTQVRQGFAQNLLRPIMEFVIVVALMGSLIWLFASGGDVSIVLPTLALLGTSAYRLVPALVRIATALQSFRFAQPQIEAVCDGIEKARALEDTDGRTTARLRVQRSLRLRGETFVYEGAAQPALADIDVEVAIGETVAFVGRSGSGKSTLVDLLSGLHKPQKGVLLVDGAPLPRDAALARDTFGYVQQDTFLIDDSIAANVTLGRRAEDIDRARVRQALLDAACGPLLDSLPLGLDAPIGERGTRLSGGQRQRIGIARALYPDPDVLVFDEATSALDNLTEREIVEAIYRLKERRAVVIVAHRLSTIRHADRIYFLDKGRVLDAGTYDALVARSPAFAAFVRTIETTQESGAAA